MARKPANTTPKNLADARQDRLKAALKANLKRRKAQARVRKSTAPEPGATKD